MAVQPLHELRRLFRGASSTVPPAEIRTAAVPEHGARRGAGVHHARHAGPGGPQALAGGAPVFQWHRGTRTSTSGSRAPRACCCCGGRVRTAYRGFFRLLSEQHIPFAVSDNLEWIGEPGVRPGDRSRRRARRAGALGARGGRLLIAGAESARARWLPKLDSPLADTRRATGASAITALFPSLKDTDLLFLDGEYAGDGAAASPLTLIPPARSARRRRSGPTRWKRTSPGCCWPIGRGPHRLRCPGTSARSTTGTARRPRRAGGGSDRPPAARTAASSRPTRIRWWRSR